MLHLKSKLHKNTDFCHVCLKVYEYKCILKSHDHITD